MKLKTLAAATIALTLSASPALAAPTPTQDQCFAMSQLGLLIAKYRDEGKEPSEVVNEYVQTFGKDDPKTARDVGEHIVHAIYVDRADETPQQIQAGFMQRCVSK